MFEVVLAQLEQLALRLPEIIRHDVLRLCADKDTRSSAFLNAHVGEEWLT